jgi:branched-chain amino acid aminotransferase
MCLQWTWAAGWHRIDRNPPLSAAVSVKAAGLRAHLRSDGTIALFRPHAYAEHFARLCVRAGAPPLSVDLFVEAARNLARQQRRVLPGPPHSLHLLARTASGGGPRDAAVFTMTAVVEANRAGLAPVRIAVDGNCTGRGAVRQHPFFVTGPASRACLLTPTIQDGPVIARDTVLQLARVLGFESREEARVAGAWLRDAHEGQITEALLCDDSAYVVPVHAVSSPHGNWRVGNGQPGAMAIALRKAMLRLTSGMMRDDAGWLDVLR